MRSLSSNGTQMSGGTFSDLRSVARWGSFSSVSSYRRGCAGYPLIPLRSQDVVDIRQSASRDGHCDQENVDNDHLCRLVRAQSG